MGLDFPNSPTIGQTFPSPPQSGVPLWVWDGNQWGPYYSASGGQYSAAVLNCGQLVYVSATQLRFQPFNGASIRINGLIYQIPAAGVSITNAGMAASSFYYIYAFMSAGVMTLEYSSTTHATDTSAANNGTEIKSGDPTRSLVGCVYVGSGAQFFQTAYQRCVRSWLNRGSFGLNSLAQGSSTAVGSSYTIVTPVIQFVAFAGEMVTWLSSIQYYNSAAGTILTCSCWLNGAALGQTAVINCDGTGRVLPAACPTYCGQMAADNFYQAYIAANINSNSATCYSSCCHNLTLTQ
jgi:hypothetical protein